MTPQQKKWADYVISGKTHVAAYLLAYPNASKKSATNQIGTFRQNLGIMGYVEKGLGKIAAKVEERVVEKLSNIEVGNVLTSAKKRELLALIALGELDCEKLVQVRDNNVDSKTYGKMIWKKMLVKPDMGERMKAIDLDNKMTGEIYRGKANDPQGEKEESPEIFNNVTFVFKSKEK